LTAEVDELKPMNLRLQEEIEALRRHLGLALGELKNPIILPKADEKDDEEEEGDSGYEEEGLHEELAAGLQNHADEILKELGLFRRRVGDDRERFGTQKGVEI